MEIYLIIGLGNPGEQYAHTRHNAGFEVMSRLEERFGVKLKKKLLLQGATAEITDGEKKIVLCEPMTFMNRSGECVKRVKARFQVPDERMLVIYDDIDLPPGKVRMRKSGGPGTHNGMRSIAEQLGETNFPRIRVGTGDRPAGQDLAAWGAWAMAVARCRRMAPCPKARCRRTARCPSLPPMARCRRAARAGGMELQPKNVKIQGIMVSAISRTARAV